MGADGTHWELPECDQSDASLLTTPVCTFNIHNFVDEDKGNLAEGDLIQFRVAAVNEIETGEWSEYNTTGPVISTLPAKLSAVVTSNFGTNIVVSWNEPTDSGSPITGYHVLFLSTEVSMPEVAEYCDPTDPTVVTGRTCTFPMSLFATTSGWSLIADGEVIPFSVAATNEFG